MKTIKNILILIFISVIAIGCIDDSATLAEQIEASPNLVGFANTRESFSVKADDMIYTKLIAVKIIGPSFADIQSDVNVTYEVDASSTAIAGTHYNISGSSLTLEPSNNMIATIPVDILTEGMNPPMETVSIVLNLVVEEGSLVLNDLNKQVKIDINYLCSSDLAGDYHMVFSSGTTDIAVSQIADGQYRASYFPTFVSIYWFEFSDICGNLMITNWQYQGSNPISPINTVVGYVDENDNLVFEGINVAGVSWYENLDFTILKN